jgi:surface-anchored protein
MISPRTRLPALLLAATLTLSIQPTASAGVWSAGHGDIGVAYDPLNPTAFEMEVHAEQGATIDGVVVTDPAGQAFEPGDITIRVPATANLGRVNDPTGFWTGLPNTGYDFTGPQYDALGVPVDSPLWVLSPSGADAEHYGTPFLGWAAEEGFAGQSFGTISFTPTSFTAPAGGNMAIYSGSTPLWVLEDGDTSFTGDSFSVPAGAHTHRTLFFTEPGIYQVGIQAAGLNGTTPVSGSAVYTFQVVPEPSTVALAALAAAAAIPLARLRRRR